MVISIKTSKDLVDTLLDQIWRTAYSKQVIVKVPGVAKLNYWPIYNKIKAHKRYVRENRLNPLFAEDWARMKRCSMFRRSGTIIIRHKFPRSVADLFTLPEPQKEFLTKVSCEES